MDPPASKQTSVLSIDHHHLILIHHLMIHLLISLNGRMRDVTSKIDQQSGMPDTEGFILEAASVRSFWCWKGGTRKSCWRAAAAEYIRSDVIEYSTSFKVELRGFIQWSQLSNEFHRNESCVSCWQCTPVVQAVWGEHPWFSDVRMSILGSRPHHCTCHRPIMSS